MATSSDFSDGGEAARIASPVRGYTSARFSATTVGSADTIRVRDNFGGFRVGAGGQYEVSPNALVGGEYRYSNYEDGISRHQSRRDHRRPLLNDWIDFGQGRALRLRSGGPFPFGASLW